MAVRVTYHRGVSDLAIVGAPATEPFSSQRELVEAELELARGRIRFALAERQRITSGERPAPGWPTDFMEGERYVAARLDATSSWGVRFPITWLSERLGLGPNELRLVWVLLAHELCAVSRGMLRDLNTENAADPTTDTVRLVAFGGRNYAEASRLLAPNSPLVLQGLIERTDTDAAAADHRKTWKIARRIAALANEDLSTDADLFRIAAVVIPDECELGIGRQGVEADPDCWPVLMAALGSARPTGESRTVVVQGQRGSGRRTLLRTGAARCKLELLEVDLRRLSSNPAHARAQLTAIARECRLFNRVPLLRDLDALVTAGDGVVEHSPQKTPCDLIELIMLELEGLLVLATTSSVIPGNRLRKPQIIEPKPLTGLQRVRLWMRALPMLSPDDADLLATMYPIAPALIAEAASVARAQLHDSTAAFAPRHLRTGLRSVLDGQLGGLANRIESKQTRNSLVLPTEQRDALDELVARVRRRRTVYETWELGSLSGRGLGVSALFTGPPGTGKTMAAGLIANELETDLYQVDISKIASKWIGETEKNLASLFDAAEAGHAILLFDEADSLFGKRTDVKTSNDRHANQETNFLLQRLESFRGVCILTTNNDTAIDEAFRRRLSMLVHFPMPDVEERTKLWRSMIGKTVPVAGRLDLAALAARYEMSGGYIRNAVLRAAFFAADADVPVSHQHLARAAQLEYQAMGRIMPSPL